MVNETLQSNFMHACEDYHMGWNIGYHIGYHVGYHCGLLHLFSHVDNACAGRGNIRRCI